MKLTIYLGDPTPSPDGVRRDAHTRSTGHSPGTLLIPAFQPASGRLLIQERRRPCPHYDHADGITAPGVCGR
ncbi:MAG: hypothetical protein WKH64_00940 [Chloroflexia bacterium]